MDGDDADDNESVEMSSVPLLRIPLQKSNPNPNTLKTSWPMRVRVFGHGIIEKG